MVGGLKLPDGTTLADVEMDPKYWPGCSNCSTPYVLRRCMSYKDQDGDLTLAMKWVWMEDCKHPQGRGKRAAKYPPAIFGPDGKVE